MVTKKKSASYWGWRMCDALEVEETYVRALSRLTGIKVERLVLMHFTETEKRFLVELTNHLSEMSFTLGRIVSAKQNGLSLKMESSTPDTPNFTK